MAQRIHSSLPRRAAAVGLLCIALTGCPGKRGDLVLNADNPMFAYADLTCSELARKHEKHGRKATQKNWIRGGQAAGGLGIGIGIATGGVGVIAGLITAAVVAGYPTNPAKHRAEQRTIETIHYMKSRDGECAVTEAAAPATENGS